MRFPIINLCITLFFLSCSPNPYLLNNSGSLLLKGKINNLIVESGLDASMGIKIVSLNTGKSIYEFNSEKLFMPASNNKLYTCAVALEKLGPDYRFKTSIYQYGKNLIIKGGGDPDLTLDQLDSLAKIISKDINSIDSLFIDVSFMDTLNYGEGWMWDEGAWWYAAPVSAMTLNDNCIDFHVDPGKLDEPAKVEMVPNTDFVSVINQSSTVNDTIDFQKFKIDRDWSGRTNLFTISGEIQDTASTDTFQRNIYDPVLFSGTVFKNQLQHYGVNVKHLAARDGTQNASLICVHTSDSLLLSAQNLMHESDNLTAELFTKTFPVNDTTRGNWVDGIYIIESFLADSVGIDTSVLRIADGSGVSRYNLSSADQLVKLLYYMYHSKHKNDFIYTLPGGGSKSTLKDRLEFSEAKIRAKTGHLSGVSCFSGYLFTEKYGPLAFSILMNGYTGSATPYKNLQDNIISFLLHD